MSKMKLVQAGATEEMADAGQTAMDTCILDGHDQSFTCGWAEALTSAPHSGKVSREAFQLAVDAHCSSITAFGCGCAAVGYPSCKEQVEATRAVIEALGLEIEE